MPNEIKLQGARELKAIMDELGPNISRRAGVRGVRKGANIMKKALKDASPSVTGTLKKEWQTKKLRQKSNGVAFIVRLKRRHYYKTLEFPTKRGPAMNRFVESTMNRSKHQVMATVMAATKTALSYEAGRAYARSKRIR